jgi:hypothetical protein
MSEQSTAEFRFGDERWEYCCAKPHGCTTVDGERCPFWNHKWKRKNNRDHPNHIPSDTPVCTSAAECPASHHMSHCPHLHDHERTSG